jgi:hypothetical protein
MFSRDEDFIDDVLGRVFAVSSYNSSMTHTTSVSADEDEESDNDLPPLPLNATFPPKALFFLFSSWIPLNDFVPQDSRDSPPKDREGMTKSLPAEKIMSGLSLSTGLTLPPASQAVMDKYMDANMYRSKSSPMSQGPVIFDGPLKYKSSIAATYDPAWYSFLTVFKMIYSFPR